jgi:two-component system, cell cycle sensor histidine kinase and response regulator CckA
MAKNEFTGESSLTILLTVLNSVDALVYVVDMETYEVLYMNQAAIGVWGDLLGDVCWKMMASDGPCPECFNGRLLAGEPADAIGPREFREYRSGKWYSVRDRVILWLDGRPVRLGVAADISEYKMIESALRESEDRYRNLVEFSPAAILVEKAGHINMVNKEATRLLGRDASELLNRLVDDALTPDGKRFRRFVSQSLQSGVPVECELTRSDGSVVTVELSAVALNHNGADTVRIQLWDLTEQKIKEEEHIKATRLESLGLLAGGIAHDFNNILTIISGYLSIAGLHAKDNDQIHQKLDEIDKAVRQAVGLTQQLLTFAKGGAPVKKVMPVTELVEETVQFALSGSNVRWSVRKQQNIPLVEVDEGQISQVISNLVINANQAMPGGGTLTVTLDKTTLSAENPQQLSAGTYVVITIADNGPGIHEDHLSRIFDPYFTTKSEGSGLGLATCYSIVKKHGGHVGVTSRYGSGASFIVYLPAVLSGGPVTTADQTIAGMGRILIMDDEPAIRHLLIEMLTYLGYRADDSVNGEEALTLYAQAEQDRDPYDAVILDLTIRGGMGGRETMERLKALNPDIRAVVSSGYSNDAVLSDFARYGFSAVVAKPYSLEELGNALKALLKEPS